MKKTILSFMAMMVCATAVYAQGLGDFQGSGAYKNYLKRPKNELSKLIYLLDRFNAPSVEIKLDGNIYTTDKAFPYSKGYLSKNYKKEKAEDWIRAHCYRSREKNEVLYMRVGNESFEPVRDVLINELGQLRALEN